MRLLTSHEAFSCLCHAYLALSMLATCLVERGYATFVPCTGVKLTVTCAMQYKYVDRRICRLLYELLQYELLDSLLLIVCENSNADEHLSFVHRQSDDHGNRDTVQGLRGVNTLH